MQSGQPNVPPELKSYYQPTRRQELQRVALLILPLLILLVIIGGLIWGGWWLTHRSATGKSSISTNHNGKTQINGSSDTGQLPTYLRPSPKPVKPHPKPSAPRPGTLVNTGPEVVTLLVPLISMIAAAVLYELRQARLVEQ